jgi:hypothetical protein
LRRWQHLDADYIKDQWRWRRSVSGWEMTSALLSVVGWCCIVLPVVTFAYVQSRGGRHMVPEHLAIACLVLAGAFFEASLSLTLFSLSLSVCIFFNLSSRFAATAVELRT